MLFSIPVTIHPILFLVLSYQLTVGSELSTWMDEAGPAKDHQSSLLLLHLDEESRTDIKDDNSSGRPPAIVNLVGDPPPTWDEGYHMKGLHLQEGKTNGLQVAASVIEKQNIRIGFFFKWDYIFKSNPGYLFNCPGEIFARASLVDNSAQPAKIRVTFGIKKADDTYLEIISLEESALDDKWHYLEFVRAWDGTLLEGIIYLDGVRTISGSAQTAPLSSGKPLFFGSDGSPNSIGGVFDEIRIGPMQQAR
jgi:hypothetical protein